MKILQEFNQFAMRGNVMDMAIGIIVGAAFGKIVSSVVSDVIMPPIGLIVGGVDFSDLAITLKSAHEGRPAVLLKIGVFINTVIDFLIVAFAIFMLVKGINALKKKEDEKPSAPPAPTKSELLLAEIRDELKKK
jgi:large conductance mechanosensitive channel